MKLVYHVTYHCCYLDGSEVLRKQYRNLSTHVEAQVTAADLYQRNAITFKDLQSVQSLRDHPVKAAETLLDIIIEQPDAVHLYFLDALKDTEQQHVYEGLVAGSYQGSCNIATAFCL